MQNRIFFCDCAGHGECGGDLYLASGGKFARCHRHIVLQSVWADTPPLCDFYDWLDGAGEEDLQIIYDTMRESVGLWYWNRISKKEFPPAQKEFCA